MNAGKVAVLVYRDNVINCPDVLNTARMWARRGCRVDVMSYHTGLYELPSLPEPNVRFVPARTLYGRILPLVRRLRGQGTENTPLAAAATASTPAPARRGRLFRAATTLARAFQKVEFCVGHALRLITGGYRFSIACDNPSLLAATATRLLRRTPLVYHSRELSLSWDHRSPGARLAKIAERFCHRRAALTIVQDAARADLLARDNGVSAEGFLLVPNAPLGLWGGGGTDFLHRRLGLPAGTPIVLHAGAIFPETMVLETIRSIGSWPDGTVLVVNGVPESTYLPALRAAAECFRGRVLFSVGLVQPAEVDALYASAAVGLALYRPVDDNFRYVGHAAGKIFNLMKVGVPVIASDLPGMRALIEDSGCGRVVADAAGIGPALAAILAAPEVFRNRCLETFPRYEFEDRYQAVIDRAESLPAP